MTSTLTTMTDLITSTAASMTLAEFQSSLLWALIIGALLAFLLGFGMGANDVSNAFGTSVGSKAVGLKTAYCMATVFETLGAVLVGYNVSDTMRKLVVDIDLYKNVPKTLLLGQVAVLAGASAWLFIATFAKLPVSTTHSVVGATLGFSIVMKGFNGIEWPKVGEIAASWVISPALSGLISSVLYVIVDHLVLRRPNPVQAGFRVLPIFYFVCLAFNTFAVSYQGSKILGLASIPLWLAFTLAIIVGLLSALIFHFIARPFLMKWINKDDESSNIPKAYTNDACSDSDVSIELGEHSTNEKQPRPSMDSRIGRGTNKVVPFQSNAKTHEITPEEEKQIQEFKLHPRGFVAWLFPVRDRIEDAKTLKLFGSIQVFTACFAGFAHGANDVSNAVAPLAAIWAIFHDMNVEQKGETPIYVLLFGVFAIVVGLWILGHRVIRTVGEDMSEIHPASGFCIEFGAAVTALCASKVGLPISTTHCLVGSVVSVGTVKSGEGIDWKLFRNVALSWIVTLPVSGVISALIMLLMKLTINMN
uniref:Phosphate transporter n=1 Tax=Panagrolaimus sp. PS1159 TaxID=55785 RepID=A0AC35GUT1_9BILA